MICIILRGEILQLYFTFTAEAAEKFLNSVLAKGRQIVSYPWCKRHRPARSQVHITQQTNPAELAEKILSGGKPSVRDPLE